MKRTKEYRRDMRNRKIRHRKYICKHVYGFDYYEHDGQYAKGKIHCGCSLCKYGKAYGLPTVRDERERSKEELLLKDYESDKSQKNY